MRYVGVDFHKRYSYVTIKDGEGKVVKEGIVSNRKESFKKFLDGSLRQPTKAVIETGNNWGLIYDWLEEMIDEVKLAHTAKVRAIAEAKIKTDKIDAKILADLLRADLIPEAYVPDKETRNIRRALRQRMFFVRIRSMLKNRIRMFLDRYPQIKEGYPREEIFTKQGIEWLKQIDLPKSEREMLNHEIQLLEELEEKIKLTNSLIRELAEGDERVKLLQTIPGIGKFFAVLIAYEIDKIERFRDKKKLASYMGLVPSVYSTGGKSYYGRLTKRGNKYLRWAIVEAVWPAIRRDLGLRLYYEKVKKRKGANKAKIAVARKMIGIIHRVLSERKPYYSSEVMEER